VRFFVLFALFIDLLTDQVQPLSSYAEDYPVLLAALTAAGLEVVEVPSSCSAGGSGSLLLPYGHGNVAEMAGWLEQSVHPLQLRVDDGNDGNDGNDGTFLCFFGCFCPIYRPID
jgi:hypothetical protein